MPRPTRLALASVCLLATTLPAQARHGSADILVDITPESVHVTERFVFAPDPASLSLRAIARPCAAIAGLRIAQGGTPVSPVPERQGPWTTWSLPAPADPSDSLVLDVSYTVDLTAARAEVPLLHPTIPFARDDTSRMGDVSLQVQLGKGAGQVYVPHLPDGTPTRRSGRFIAVPSFVSAARLSSNLPDRCAEERASGDSGGLVWRFALLVGIMVAWVPIYLAWARRRGDDA